MKWRVAVTGLGVVSPIGCDVASFTGALLAGTCAAGPITLFDPADLSTHIACEVKLPAEKVTFRDRKISFALHAAQQALDEAGRCGSSPGGDEAGSNAGVSLGIGLELFEMEDLVDLRVHRKPFPADLASRLTCLQTPSNLVVHLLSHRHRLQQPPSLHISACAASNDAIGQAYRLVATGRRRWMVAGGTDSMINPLGVGGFCKLRATSTRNDSPQTACRPFERRRDGFVLGEGSAMFVLERWEDAQARGATIHAEVVGYGNSFDAHGITEPHPEGRGALQAMKRALDDAGLEPDAIDAVNAHGTGTPKNDVVETLALKQLLGERAYGVPVYAMKSMIGHLTAAAGAVEVAGAIVCMEAGQVPPTLNLDEPDPACDLDYVPHRSRVHAQNVVLCNSFGFGGQNAALLLRRSHVAGG